MRGRRVVHLSAASIRGAAGFAPLQNALREASPPAIDTTGPCDAERLAGIHLDPPAPVPGIGEGRWLTAATPAYAMAILGALGVGEDTPPAEMEIRHTATRAVAPGAVARVPGPFLLHAVVPAPTTGDRPGVQDALDAVRAAAEPVDAGRAAASFRDGRTTARDALDPDARARLETIRRRLDPHDLIRYARRI